VILTFGSNQFAQYFHSAVNHHDRRKRKTVMQARKDLRLARSTYNRWKKALDENPEWIKGGAVPTQGSAPKRNRMALPTVVRQRIENGPFGSACQS